MHLSDTETGYRTGSLPGIAVTIFGILLVLYATLFPFDFFWTDGPSSLKAFINTFDGNFTRDYAIENYPPNILLFIPFGAGLTAYIRRFNPRIFLSAVFVILGGAFLSILVESLQIYLAGRFPSFADILANGIGAALGFWISHLTWNRLEMSCRRLPVRLRQPFPFGVFTVALFGYLSSIAIFYTSFAATNLLQNWDPGFPLIFGNEETGDRPWKGSISNVLFFSRGFSQNEVRHLFELDKLEATQNSKLIAWYPFNDVYGVRERTGQMPELAWKGIESSVNSSSGVTLGSGTWLTTIEPAYLLGSTISNSSAFSIAATVASASPEQYGPARIISISSDPYHRNFTLGQEGDDLILRLRTAITGENGREPEFVLPDLFVDKEAHRIVVVYRDAVLKLYIDDVTSDFTFDMNPDVMLFWLAPPSMMVQVRLNAYHSILFKLLFGSAILFPLATWFLLLLANFVRWSRDAQVIQKDSQE